MRKVSVKKLDSGYIIFCSSIAKPICEINSITNIAYPVILKSISDVLSFCREKKYKIMNGLRLDRVDDGYLLYDLYAGDYLKNRNMLGEVAPIICPNKESAYDLAYKKYCVVVDIGMVD